jgi:hypothetical protein
MEKYCQNPFCENEATKQVLVSIDKAGDQKRSLCAVCEEVYTWGVQHGRMTPQNKRLWVLAVTDRGTVVHGRIFRKRPKAVKGLAEYLRANEGYTGSADLPSICAWMAAHNERLGADIFPASVDLT